MSQEVATTTTTTITCDQCGATIPASSDVFRLTAQHRVAASELPPGYDWLTDSIPSNPPENNVAHDFCSWDHALAFFGDAARQKSYQEGRDQHVADVAERYENTQRVKAEREGEEGQ